MKMIQTDICLGMPNYEIFYDGQLPVEYSNGTYGIVDIPRQQIHWRDVLLMRGYRDLPEETEAPKPATRAKRKVSDE